MLKEKIKMFAEGSEFLFEGKAYTVDKSEIKHEKAVILTDKRTFVLYENELVDFIEKISFTKDAHSISVVPEKLHPTTLENVHLVIKQEIAISNQRANRMAGKMEEMFNRLADAPNEETIKQAQAMRDMSNSIVNVEMMKFKILSGL